MSRPPIPRSLREKVKNRFNGRCGYCGEIANKMCIDHMKPYRSFWHNPESAHEESNLMPACFACNSLKNIFDVEAFRVEISNQLNRANNYSVNYRTAKRFGQIKETPSEIVFYFEKEIKIPTKMKGGGCE